MRYLPIFFLFAALFSACSTTQITVYQDDYVKVNDTFYVSKGEVTNRMYRAYLDSLKSSGNNQELEQSQLDTLRWKEPLLYGEPFAKLYHKNENYDQYPAVNMSHEAAVNFCKWLTTKFNNDPDRQYDSVLFRLPTAYEWEYLARAGSESAIYPWDGEELLQNGNAKANFFTNNKALDTDSAGEMQKTTAPVNSYRPNDFGLYNMSGNVAEMIEEKGIAKGGSWAQNEDYLRISKEYEYWRAAPYIGFRPVMVIIRNKNNEDTGCNCGGLFLDR